MVSPISFTVGSNVRPTIFLAGSFESSCKLQLTNHILKLNCRRPPSTSVVLMPLCFLAFHSRSNTGRFVIPSISLEPWNLVYSHRSLRSIGTQSHLHRCHRLLCHAASSGGLFSRRTDYDIFTYNSLFQVHSRGSTPGLAISLYNEMRRHGIFPNHFTFPFVLKACGRLLVLPKGQELHSASIQLGYEFDVFVQNSLIYMYSTCGDMGTARRVFDCVPVDVGDVVTWNSMISGYLQRNRSRDALDVFRRMRMNLDLVAPNEVTAVGVLTASARITDLRLGRKVHGMVLVNGFVLDVFVGAALIDMYVKCGMVEDAERVFDIMPDRNVVCWTSMISGYSQSGQFKEAIDLFRKMQIMEIDVDPATVVCVLSACGHLGALDIGRWVHMYCERKKVEFNIKVKNALIDMYSKCGDINRALQIFYGLVHRDVFSWTIMITGLAMNGKSMDALQLFLEMELASNVAPNEITFLGVLSACSHGGLIEEGHYYFKNMKEKYNIVATLEHYGCMVDLLGRANLLADAQKFIRAMPIEPDAVIWRSILFACISNNNADLAELAAKKILQLEPRKCGVHVLLSNIYASASRWIDAKRVRKEMKDYRIRKLPGCSFIEIDGAVHEFLVSDISHPRSEIIHQTVLEIDCLIKCDGDVSDISE
ncbi:hypothetical protein H6P81_013449 [Aristolochia fimbriata]|uniref:Uncharacterized protein n=1 Tax=Aristolochia fimbriata TaxID=158543 RepID=A0AAV7EG06_ARIFI|nr:hypothetical protein H6P81_013449 [Aristolochia fimbriata]